MDQQGKSNQKPPEDQTNTEYQIIRDEMLLWQSHRFNIASISISVVTAVLALDLLKGENAGSSWDFLSPLLLAFLSSTSLLTWYCAIVNTKLSEYLKCFSEDFQTNVFSSGFKWEKRLQKLGELGSNPLHLNQLLALLYLILGLFSVLLPWHIAKKEWIDLLDPAIVSTASFFLLTLILNLLRVIYQMNLSS